MNDIKPRSPFLWIKYKILEWQWDLILFKSHCRTWEEYFLENDRDFNSWASTVETKFIGYPHIASIQYRDLPKRELTIFRNTKIIDHRPIDEWLRKNCRGKHRIQTERMISKLNTDITKSEISGTFLGEDYFFVGFTDERDYIMFVLRWK